MILLVDNDHVFLEDARAALSAAGPVMLARDAAHTRTLMESIAFDVVLVALNLPDGNGFELIEELRADRPEVAVVAISGAASPQALESAVSLGAMAVLRKPVSEEWTRILKRVVRMHRKARED